MDFRVCPIFRQSQVVKPRSLRQCSRMVLKWYHHFWRTVHRFSRIFGCIINIYIYIIIYTYNNMYIYFLSHSYKHYQLIWFWQNPQTPNLGMFHCWVYPIWSLSRKHGELRCERASTYQICSWVPSGNGWHSYWKWPFIVDLPIENGDFP